MYNKLISSTVLCALLGASSVVFGMEHPSGQPEYILALPSAQLGNFPTYNFYSQNEQIKNTSNDFNITQVTRLINSNDEEAKQKRQQILPNNDLVKNLSPFQQQQVKNAQTFFLMDKSDENNVKIFCVQSSQSPVRSRANSKDNQPNISNTMSKEGQVALLSIATAIMQQNLDVTFDEQGEPNDSSISTFSTNRNDANTTPNASTNTDPNASTNTDPNASTTDKDKTTKTSSPYTKKQIVIGIVAGLGLTAASIIALLRYYPDQMTQLVQSLRNLFSSLDAVVSKQF